MFFLSTFQALLHLILWTTLGEMVYYPHFKEEKTEAGGGVAQGHPGSKCWRCGLYSVLSGSQAHAFHHSTHIPSGCQGKLI